MSFGSPTPESLVVRSDSKNPATTCKGITTNGRPCRRSLAQSPGASPTPSPNRGNGVLAVLEEQDAAAFYCWQHKDQAEKLGQRNHKTRLYPLLERTSLDTLAERVGVIDLDEEITNAKSYKSNKKNKQTYKRRDNLPPGWHDMQGPVMSIKPGTLPGQPLPRQKPPKRQSNVKFSWTCCIRTDDSDDDIAPRRRTQHVTHRVHDQPSMTQPTSVPPMQQGRPVQRGASTTSASNGQARPAALGGRSPSNHTQGLLSLIPSTHSPQTTSSLLAELSRPISAADEEGYIYMFWLTPDSEGSKPDDDTASSLLDAPVSANNRRASDALRRYGSVRKTANEPRTIMLKIGRAANVHRRLSQWTKQCGQNITLIRFYPYDSSTGAGPPRKVPHVHRVERLIHIELTEKRVSNKGPCEQCGVEHREWFEIEATRKGLKDVDEVIRRWTSWAERQASAR